MFVCYYDFLARGKGVDSWKKKKISKWKDLKTDC